MRLRLRPPSERGGEVSRHEWRDADVPCGHEILLVTHGDDDLHGCVGCTARLPRPGCGPCERAAAESTIADLRAALKHAVAAVGALMHGEDLEAGDMDLLRKAQALIARESGK